MSNNMIQIKGLDKLEKKLSNMSKKLNKYDGKNTISLPFTNEQWNTMTESEKSFYIEQAKKGFINDVVKDVFH